MFCIQPNAVKAEMGRLTDVTGDEVTQTTHSHGLTTAESGECFTFAQFGLTFYLDDRTLIRGWAANRASFPQPLLECEGESGLPTTNLSVEFTRLKSQMYTFWNG